MKYVGFALIFLSLGSVAAPLQHSIPDSFERTNFKEVYFGLAGPSPGLGAFGHAYAFFTMIPGQFSDSVVYQYNLKVNERSKDQLSENKDRGWLSSLRILKTSPFVVARERAADFFERYQNEDRALYLFQSEFDSLQVQGLLENLEADRQEREEHPRFDYDLSDSNCLTKIIDAFNAQIVDPTEKIPSSWQAHKGFQWSRGFSKESVTANVPLLMVQSLRKTKWFKKEPLILKPAAVALTQVNLAILKRMTSLKSACRLSERESEFLSRLLMNPAIRQTNSFLNYFHEKTVECVQQDPAAQESYVDILSMLFAEAKSEDIQNTILGFMGN